MSQGKDPNDARQATEKGNTRTVLTMSLIAIVVLIGLAYWFLASQDTGETVDGTVVDPDSEAVDAVDADE